MKRVVVFDFGGVLADLDLNRAKNMFKQVLGFHKIDDILDSSIQAGIVGDMEIGRISADQFRDAVLKDSLPGKTHSDVDDALQSIIVGMDKKKVDLLKKMSQKYDIYMLTNNNPICYPKTKQLFEQAGAGVETLFKKCYVSYQMKMMKPSAEFYTAVMEDIGAPAEDMLFIDDSQINVDAANAAGLPSVYYKPGSDLARLLAAELNDKEILEGLAND